MWQGIHAELAPSGFTVIAAALDTGGPAAVEPWIRPADLKAHCPPPLRDLLGHTDEDWARAGTPEYPCLIDEHFDISRDYGILQVPTTVWIDEAGTVVRGPEAAGASDGVRHLDPATFAMPPEVVDSGRQLRTAYFDAIRDWVEKGAASRFVGSAGARPAPSAEERRSDAAFRLGVYVHTRGDREGAQRHFDEARSLRPLGFAYHRQARVMADPDLVGELDLGIFQTLATLGDNHFYEPIDL